MYGSGALINNGTISSGTGGVGGTSAPGFANGGSASIGVAGVVGTNLTVTNAGAIVGGTGSTGQADAITFLGGSNSLTLSGGGTVGTLTGGIGITGSLSLDPGTAAGASVTLNGVIHGTGSVDKVGAGTLVLAGANTYSGGTYVDGGVLDLAGPGQITGGVYVRSGTVRFTNLAGAGTNVIHLIDPTIDLPTQGTNSNPYSLDVAAPASADPSVFNNSSGGTVVLSGAITTGTGNNANSQAIDPNQYVTFSGGGVTQLTNTANSWTGITQINSGATLSGTTATISGSSIIDNGTVIYNQATNVSLDKVVTGTGTLTKQGAGTLTLSQADTVGLTITAGAVNLTGSLTGAVGDGSYGSSVLLSGDSTAFSNSGSVQSGAYIGVRVTGAGDTVTNTGSIVNSGTGGTDQVGAAIADYATSGTLTINNGSATNSTALLKGNNNGVNQRGSSTGAITLNNYGTVTGNVYSAVENSGSAGLLTVNNFGTGVIYANNSGNGLNVNGTGGAAVTNAGKIVGVGAGVSAAATSSVSNTGVIAGGTYSTSGSGAVNASGTYGVYLGAGGTITNGASTSSYGQNSVAQIAGGIGIQSNTALMLTNYGVIAGTSATLAGVNASGATSTITNSATGTGYGAISGGAQAIVLNNGGTVYNYGTGSSLTATGTSSLADASGIYSNGALTLVNQGTISTAHNGAAYGVEVLGVGMITNSGTITANSATAGISTTGAGSQITNQAGGVVTGAGNGVNATAATTLTNSGTIASGEVHRRHDHRGHRHRRLFQRRRHHYQRRQRQHRRTEHRFSDRGCDRHQRRWRADPDQLRRPHGWQCERPVRRVDRRGRGQ